jgi:thymidylate synthase
MQDTDKRSNLKINIIMVAVLTLLGSGLFGLLYGIHNLTKGSVHVYDCTIAEISPDFSPEMREKCRQLRATKN